MNVLKAYLKFLDPRCPRAAKEYVWRTAEKNWYNWYVPLLLLVLGYSGWIFWVAHATLAR